MTPQENVGVETFLLEFGRRVGKDRTTELLEAVTNRCRLAGAGDMLGWLEQWEFELAASASPSEIEAASVSLVLAIAAVKEYQDRGRQEAEREGAGREAREAGTAGADARPDRVGGAEADPSGVSDLPRSELMALASETLRTSPPGTMVWFKFTCEQCGERCVLADPNTLHERGECHVCGHETEIVAGGMLLAMKIEPPRPEAKRGRPN